MSGNGCHRLRPAPVSGWGAGIPKAFVELCGQTMLERAVDGLLASGVIDRVVVAVPADRVADTGLPAGRARPRRHRRGRTPRHRPAGARRDRRPEFVVVHDAARPLTPPTRSGGWWPRSEKGCKPWCRCCPWSTRSRPSTPTAWCWALPRTVRAAGGADPQGFSTELLRRAYQRAGSVAVTDDASLVEHLGTPGAHRRR